MLRHAFVRRPRARRAAVAAAASALLAGAAIPLLPTSASAAGSAQETVVPPAYRSSYTAATLVNPDTAAGGDAAGVLGVFHRLEGHPGVVWTRYADGRSFDAPSTDGALVSLGTGSDVLAYRYDDGHVDLWNAVDGTTTTLHVPAGQTLYNVFGALAVSYEDVTAEDGTTSRLKHLLTAGPDGTTRDVPVGEVPPGMVLGGPVRGDAAGLVFFARVDGAATLVDVAPETGRIRARTATLPTSTGSTYTKLSPEHLVVFGGVESTKAYVYSRSDLSAAPVEVTLDSTGSRAADDLAVVGDWLVHRPGSGAKVTAVPMAGGEPVTLFTASNSGVSAAPDGSAVVIGRTGADDWGVQRISAGDDGRPTVRMAKALPRPPYKVQGLSLDQGRLLVADESSGGYRDDYVRTVAATGTPTFGERSSYDGTVLKLYGCAATDVGCSQLHATADNRAVWLAKDTATSDRLRVNGPTTYGLWEREVPAGGRITDVSGRYLIHTSATTQTVMKIGGGAPDLTRAPGAAALSGDVLWAAGSTPGTLTAYDLTAKKTVETLTTDAGCAPTELQALGRWIYWTCDGRAGVFDRTAKKSVAVPAGEAKLGDGYVVTHDKAAGKLTLTTVAGGSAESRVIGDMPDTGVSQRDVRWTVDESGANAAYVDDQERVHLVPSGVAQQPLRLLAPAENVPSVRPHTIDTVPDTLTTLLLSKPAANWTVTARNRATGKTYQDNRDDGPARGEVNVGWFGDDPALPGDAFAPDGSYDWTVTVTPADGVGAPLQVRGTVRLKGGSPVRHDHVGSEGDPDGTGDLLTLNSSGGLTFQQGDGKGAFAGKVTGTGWSTKTVAVPFGDLNGDRCNDVLVRMSDGSLRGYRPACGTAPTPSTAYKALGTGWNAYDVLTSPGDLTGDGRPDLLARKASTADIHLFAAKSDGTLAAGKKIRTAWTGYTKIVGAGDLNGDGIGDVLARDKAGTLYRYAGTGTGLLKDRVKVFSGWGGSYNAIVGVGDITGDGKNDLVERDTSGNVYRNAGTGNGSFGPRVKIVGGWQGYKGLF
ncbi:FG-GAP repeat domain-containing protein [Streptomyces sp. NPDC059445]|uniref:FG-GAP repeat domain-containing protein n=1 Tax=Streptomyces sp. NPDC059445 TaxID=3346832 RepID=UPI0036A4CB17